MLRINLLPPYIYDKQKKIPWIVGSLALIPITLGVLLWWGAIAQAAVVAANERKEKASTEKSKYDQREADIKKEQAAVAATKAKQTFVSNAIVYNQAWPQVYTTMRNVTSPRVLLKSMYVSDDRKSVNFTGWCQHEEDLVRWWMYLRSQAALFTNVHFRLPDHPWPPKEEAGVGGGGGGQGGSMRGAMGMPPGGAPGGMGNTPAGMGGGSGPGGAPPLMTNSGGGGGGQGAASFGGGGGNSDAIGPEEIEGKKGIKFSAFVTLKEPFAKGITPPAWAAGGAPAGGGGPGGGPGIGGSGGMMMPSGVSGGGGR